MSPLYDDLNAKYAGRFVLTTFSKPYGKYMPLKKRYETVEDALFASKRLEARASHNGYMIFVDVAAEAATVH